MSNISKISTASAQKSNNAISKQTKDIRQEVTDRIIGIMEQGTEAWQKTWTSAAAAGLPTNAATGATYRGINIVTLWLQAQASGFTSSQWMTYRQASNIGGQVRKGERGTGIIFYSPFEVTDDQTGEVKQIPILKSFTVFNIDQIDNLPNDMTPTVCDSENNFKPITSVDALIKATDATISHGGSKAFYNATTDAIQLPKPEDFTSSENYYATAGHELIHWTGHSSRLDRLNGASFGSDDYAREELIAELGAAFVAAHFNIVEATIENHASYLGHWLRVLKEDKNAIFQAAGAAQKAFDFLLKAA